MLELGDDVFLGEDLEALIFRQIGIVFTDDAGGRIRMAKPRRYARHVYERFGM